MKIGFLSMPIAGHLNPMIALARKLRSRGHDIVFFGLPDAERAVRAAELPFFAFGQQEYPIGSTSAAYAHLARLQGDSVIRYSLQKMHPNRCRITLKQLPGKVKAAELHGVVLDTNCHFAELVPLSLKIPYVHVWNSLHFDGSGKTPPFTESWPMDSSPAAVSRNQQAVGRLREAFAPVRKVAESWVRQHSSSLDRYLADTASSAPVVITQTPQNFDFEEYPKGAAFHYTGPFHDGNAREDVSFPWHRLTGQPLLYASLGTLVNGLSAVFRIIVQAVSQIPNTQLVLSAGTNVSAESLGPLLRNMVLVQSAPQLELLKRASLCITHAGLNTVLESAACGVPIVAIPIGFDQPGVAARVAHHQLGNVIPLSSLTNETLTEAIREVLSNNVYRRNSRLLQQSIAATDGLSMAADIIEQTLR